MKLRHVVLFIVVLAGAGLLLRGLPDARKHSDSLRVVTCNIGDLNGRHADLDRVVEILSEPPRADVVLLQEVWGKAVAAEAARRLKMGHYVYANYKRYRYYGLAILADRPLRGRETYFFPSSQDSRGVLFARVSLAGEPVTVASVHLDRIRKVRAEETVDISMGEALSLLQEEMTRDNVRSRCVEDLLQWLPERYRHRLVLGGDFNTVPLSKAIRLMNGRFKDALWPSVDYFKGSYSKSPLPLPPRLDYIFHTEDLVCTSSGIASRPAGDHHPVEAVFGL